MKGRNYKPIMEQLAGLLDDVYMEKNCLAGGYQNFGVLAVFTAEPPGMMLEFHQSITGNRVQKALWLLNKLNSQGALGCHSVSISRNAYTEYTFRSEWCLPYAPSNRRLCAILNRCLKEAGTGFQQIESMTMSKEVMQ